MNRTRTQDERRADLSDIREANARATARYLARFEQWWFSEGSSLAPKPGEDASEHTYRMTKLAWSNGAYCAAEEHVRLAGEVARLLAEAEIPLSNLRKSA